MSTHPKLKAFYNSQEWITFREAVMVERGFYCEHCGRLIVDKNELTVHHIEELTPFNVDDPMISLNPDNVLVVHAHPCHDEIHKRFGFAGKQKVYIVYGAPLSGKTSYVKRYKGHQDLVVDMDRLYQAVTLLPLYHKPNSLLQNVLTIRDALLYNIRTRKGKWQNAWVIGGYPDKYRRNQLKDQLGAELIFIDEPKDICIARIAETGRDEHEWKKFIDNWFEKYSA